MALENISNLCKINLMIRITIGPDFSTGIMILQLAEWETVESFELGPILPLEQIGPLPSGMLKDEDKERFINFLKSTD